MADKKTAPCHRKTSQRPRLLSVLLVGAVAPSLLWAGPDGGQVVGGSGSISQSGINTTINQTSQNMAINWQSYNLNANERVQYRIRTDDSARWLYERQLHFQ